MTLRTAVALGALPLVGLLVMTDRPVAQGDLPMAKAETVGVSSKRLERVKAFIQNFNIRPLFSVVASQTVVDSLADQRPKVMGYETPR